MRRRLAALCVLVTVAAVAAGCGGDSETGATSEQVTAGAELLRQDTLLYAALDTDLDSAQWEQLDELLRKFPGRDDLIRELRESLEDEGVDYERDVEPALGPALYVALTELREDGDPTVVALHEPADAEAFEEVLRKGDDPPAFRRLDDGWYALASDEAHIDAALREEGAQSLAELERFQDAIAVGQDEALAKLYVDAEALIEAVRELGREAGFVPEGVGLESIDSYSASFSAEDEGVRLDGEATGDLEASGYAAEPFESTLVPGIPGDALAVISAHGRASAGQLEDLREQPGVEEGLEQFEQMLGVSLDDLLPLLQNELALYVRSGSPIPEVTLVLETPDEAEARSTVDELMANVARLTGGERSEGTVDGVDVTSVAVSGVSIHYGFFDGRLLLTSARNAFADFRSDGDKLADAATFEDVQEAAGMPDENGGFVYLNLREGIPLALDFAQLADEQVPEQVSANVRPLTAFLAYGTAEGDTASFSAFLKID